MKKLFLLLTCIFFWNMASAEINDRKISFKELPQSAQTFIKKHFAKHRIVRTEIDTDCDYEVELNNGIEVKFNNEGVWTDIDCPRTGVPASAIPAEVKSQVHKQYPSHVKVTQIERKYRHYEVELSNNTEIKVYLDDCCE